MPLPLGPMDVIKLKGKKLSAAAEPDKEMPGKFVVRAMSKVTRRNPKPSMEEYEFDARTKEDANGWVDFIL